jgi:AmmeMemoRadiSam system protein B
MMHIRKKIIIYFFLPALIFSAGVAFIWNVFDKPLNIVVNKNSSKAIKNQNTNFRTPVLTTTAVPVLFDFNLFSSAVRKFPPHQGSGETDRTSTIRGAIVPHHDVASGLIAEIFQKLSLQHNTIKRFIVIGPNHPDAGSFPALTGHVVWQLPQGKVQTDDQGVGQLLKTGLVKLDTVVVSKEHSIFNLTPFIHYYFPEAQIVPIILSSTHNLKKSEQLVQELKNFIDADTVILASVDFSHYLPSVVAPRKDKIIKAAILNHDYATIAHLNNDFLDSPPSLIAFLKLMEFESAKNITIVSNTNSGIILDRELRSSTSYFTITFE